MKIKKLLINKKDYINNLKTETLELEVNDSDEYSCSFTLTNIKQDDLDFFIASQGAEIQFLNENDEIVYGANIYNTKADLIAKGINDIVYEVEIETQSYTESCSRISAKWEVSPYEADPDLNQMEISIFNFANKYLANKGFIVKKENIVTGLHIKEISSEDVDSLKTFTEVMDFLTDKSNSHWYISKEKIFYVDRGISKYRIIEDPFVFVDDTNTDIPKNRHFLEEDFSIEITNEDYFNKLILHGAQSGDHYVLDENYLDENGDLIYRIENKTEQERMAKLNSTDGVVEKEETNSKLDTVENLKLYADQLIAKYGVPVLKLNCKLIDGSIDLNIGDFIYVKHNHRFDNYLKTYKPELENTENLIFCVDSVSDVDYGGVGTTMKELTLSQRDENSVSKSFWEIFKDDTTPYQIPKNANLFTNSITIQMTEAISTSASFYKVEGE